MHRGLLKAFRSTVLLSNVDRLQSMARGKTRHPPAKGRLINNGETESVRSSFRDVASKRTHPLIKDTIPADIGK